MCIVFYIFHFTCVFAVLLFGVITIGLLIIIIFYLQQQMGWCDRSSRAI